MAKNSHATVPLTVKDELGGQCDDFMSMKVSKKNITKAQLVIKADEVGCGGIQYDCTAQMCFKILHKMYFFSILFVNSI